ncbi:XrtA/PEP-CTERM system histidine kinase PrsK [Marinobacter sp. UBA2688]|jgi:putative PEP-CTERM system histidine kinase|uniref:XrtA/PEP-CTERM system histidine kinase PrsK n=1 Tax=Marinobacter sp. UBA2688 TaxID=1946816 RepID=UPI00257BFF65|nr:XrtA/PEP-CTERM system histidine kinase PrsK [Marinobacter sp. UBA2688]|tara:strand:+ start:1971 stop:4103 length:2133 start_codon:yes stop_codon:yes gene_type:complete
MLNNFSLISHSTAAIAFGLLSLLIATRYLRRDIDRSLLLAAVVTTLWAGSLVTQSLWGEPSFFIRYLLELLRDAAWITVLFALLRDSFRSANLVGRLRKVLAAATLILVALLLGSGVLEYFFGLSILDGKTKVVGQIALSLLGLSLIEQIWRNSVSFGRSSMKYVCIAVGSLFAFDFFMYADTLLFGQVSESFWNARGLVNAALVPLFAVNVINTRKQPVDFQLSRSAVFHAGALILAGGYLLFLSLGGYYVKTLGGEWGDALQVLFFSIALVFLVTLLVSRRVRSRLMVFISQNFFDYKYDYRDEWLKMTREMADLSDSPPLPERVIRILSGLVESNAGALWIREERGDFILKNAVNMVTPKYTTIDANSELVRFFGEREWIIDLHEYRGDPVSYNLLEIPDPISHTPDGWLVIPLYLSNDLYGIAMVGNPYARVELNWENFDLIKVVARQTCNLLAQTDAQNRLSRAMQFEAVSKASAFMVHDLKTLIAQLSLLVKNAPRHRNNPAFIDDMIHTTDHAVRKMSNLVDHIRKPADETLVTEVIDLTEVVSQLAEHYSRRQPAPRVADNPGNIFINADREQLYSILGHLIQNAQDATPPDGEITLTLKTAKGNVVLFIQDTGSGMTEDFIQTQLFKPFESTKGLTGMGIGAYQAREYVRNVGGNIDVTSEPDLGSCFSIRFPLARFKPEQAPEEPERLITGDPLPQQNAK